MKKVIICIVIIVVCISGFVFYNIKNKPEIQNDGINGIATFKHLGAKSGYGISIKEGDFPIDITIEKGKLNLEISNSKGIVFEETNITESKQVVASIPESGFYILSLSGKRATGSIKYNVSDEAFEPEINGITLDKPDYEYVEITDELDEDDLFYITMVDKNDANTYTLRGVLYTKFVLSRSELEDAIKNGGYKYLDQSGVSNEYINYVVKKDYQESDSSSTYDYAFLREDNNELCFYARKKDDDTYYIQNFTQFVDEWKLTDEYRKITVPENLVVETDGDSPEVKDYFNDFEEIEVVKDFNPQSRGYNLEFENEECSKIIEVPLGC